MTSEEMEKVLHAYNKGKTIEYWSVTTHDWHLLEAPIFNFNDVNYRIKQEPKYRPYNSAKEFIKAFEEHGHWIFAGDEAELPVCATDFRVILPIMEPDFESQHSFVTYPDLLSSYTWADGTRCGVLENG